MSDQKTSDIVELFKEFSAKSSLPSLNQVSSARRLPEKVFWLCIGITATSAATYHLYTLICTYMEHNYYTSITNDFDQPLQVGTKNLKYIFEC